MRLRTGALVGTAPRAAGISPAIGARWHVFAECLETLDPYTVYIPESEMDDHKMYYDTRDLWPLLVQAGFRPSRLRCFPHKLGLNTFAVCKTDG